MIRYPIEFKSETIATQGIQANWQTQLTFDHLNISVPPEFMGPGGSCSPEDLYNAALANCFIATFKVYADISKLIFKSIEVNSKLIVDLDEKKLPIMKDFFLCTTI